MKISSGDLISVRSLDTTLFNLRNSGITVRYSEIDLEDGLKLCVAFNEGENAFEYETAE